MYYISLGISHHLNAKSLEKFSKNNNTFEAFANIYNFYVDDLLSYGLSLGFDEDTCRDAVHDVFYKIYRDKNKLVHVEDVKSYLFRSIRNQLFNIHNKRARISPLTDEEIPFTTDVTILDTIISKEDSERLKQTVSELLDELTPRQREAIYLRYMQEMDYKDIAEVLKMDSNSARRLVHRGIKALRENESITKEHLFFLSILLASQY